MAANHSDFHLLTSRRRPLLLVAGPANSVESKPPFNTLRTFMMRWLLMLLKSVWTQRPGKTDRAQLLGMYFGESNEVGRRRSNRDRA